MPPRASRTAMVERQEQTKGSLTLSGASDTREGFGQAIELSSGASVASCQQSSLRRTLSASISFAHQDDPPTIPQGPCLHIHLKTYILLLYLML